MPQHTQAAHTAIERAFLANGRRNRDGLVVTDTEVALLLVSAAESIAMNNCTDRQCQPCSDLRLLWNSLHGALSYRFQSAVTETLWSGDIPLPVVYE